MRPTALLLALCAVGCCKPRIEFREVTVPVPVPCPQPPAMAWPDLPIYHLERYKTPAEHAQAWALSVQILSKHLEQSYALLDGYRTKGAK